MCTSHRAGRFRDTSSHARRAMPPCGRPRSTRVKESPRNKVDCSGDPGMTCAFNPVDLQNGVYHVRRDCVSEFGPDLAVALAVPVEYSLDVIVRERGKSGRPALEDVMLLVTRRDLAQQPPDRLVPEIVGSWRWNLNGPARRDRHGHEIRVAEL